MKYKVIMRVLIEDRRREERKKKKRKGKGVNQGPQSSTGTESDIYHIIDSFSCLSGLKSY